jgi:hypothetical protein
MTEQEQLNDMRLKEIENKLEKLSGDVEDLVSAWKAASWLVSVVKWVGSIAVALTAIISLSKGLK